ncbi:hypothetical protein GCM10010201_30220 [Pilimelia columellifera subsp. columellifera]|uniref:Uncharacterized protein n=1 Tax=Pilimelia columellifera subsp. columellifera TaxID=706583 RepID=A0ABN3NPG0_9ACTN
MAIEPVTAIFMWLTPEVGWEDAPASLADDQSAIGRADRWECARVR